MKKGKFIVIEGLDGCGKSTISKEMQKKYDAITLNALPPEIKSWLHSIGETKLPEATFSYFTLCNLINSHKIEEIIKTGKNVIIDRYFYTTYVYHQKLIQENFPEIIKKSYVHLLNPDLVVFLNVSQKERSKRINQRKGELQWYGDAVSLEFDLTEKYFKLFKELNVKSFIVDNETNSVEESLKLIYSKIDSL